MSSTPRTASSAHRSAPVQTRTCSSTRVAADDDHGRTVAWLRAQRRTSATVSFMLE